MRRLPNSFNDLTTRCHHEKKFDNGCSDSLRLDFLETQIYYEQIFVADTRDVIFQGDVFESFKGYSNCRQEGRGSCSLQKSFGVQLILEEFI